MASPPSSPSSSPPPPPLLPRPSPPPPSLLPSSPPPPPLLPRPLLPRPSPPTPSLPIPPENPAIARLPWIQTSHDCNAPTIPFVRVGDFSRCETPSTMLSGCFLIARIQGWVLLQEAPTNTFLFHPPSLDRAILPSPPPPGRVTCTALLSRSPDDHEFWIVIARGSHIFGCRPRTGYWFSTTFRCEFISMAPMATGDALCCLTSDLTVARYDFGPSTDHVIPLSLPSDANFVPRPSRDTEHFLVLHDDQRQILVVVVTYDLNWSPPSVVSVNIYLVIDDLPWELVGPNAVRDHFLVLVNGGHSFSMLAPPGLRGTMVYLVPRAEFYTGTNLLWIVLDLERDLSFARYVETTPP